MNDWREYEYLEHHGIRGMKWGIKNGPPYPLEAAVSAAIKTGGAIKSMKKKIDAKNAENAVKKKQEQQEKLEKAKQKVIRSGNKNLVDRYQHRLSTTEFEEAVKRCELNKRLSQTEIKKMTQADKWQVNTQKAVSRVKTGVEAWNTFAMLYNTMNEKPIFRVDGSYYKNQAKKKAEHSAIDTFNDAYLEHHGILGMKWGKRNGPPYPLGAGDHSASEKKAGWRKSLDKTQKTSTGEKKDRSKDDSSSKNVNEKTSTSNKQLTEDSFKPYKGYDDYMVYNTRLKDSSGKELDVMLSYSTGSERDNALMISNLNKAVKSFDKINNDSKHAVENYNGLKDWGIKSSDLSMPRVHAYPWEDSIVLTYYDKKTGHGVDIEYDLKNKKVTGYGVNG